MSSAVSNDYAETEANAIAEKHFWASDPMIDTVHNKKYYAFTIKLEQLTEGLCLRRYNFKEELTEETPIPMP